MIDPFFKQVLQGMVDIYSALGSMDWVRGQYQTPEMQEILRQYPEVIPDLQDLGVI